MTLGILQDVEEAQNATAVWKEEYEKSELRIVGFEKKISKLQSNVVSTLPSIE